MLILASPTDKLQVVTSLGGSVNVHASFLDNVSGTVSPGRQNTTITTATTTDVVSPPGGSIYRNLKTLHVYNAGTAANGITVQHTDGTTTVTLHNIIVGPGATLQYIDEVGFLVTPPPAPIPVPQCGRLKYVSPTQLSFAPFLGDKIQVNGQIFSIPPTSGIAGLISTSCFVNGVAGQHLGASVYYFVYCFNNAGVLTADFSSTTHITSATTGNVGVEIKSGDNTRTLIGLAYMNPSSQFVDAASQRFVRSWFNRQCMPVQGPWQSVSGFSTSGSVIGAYGTPAEFVSFADDAIAITVAGFNDAASPDALYTQAFIDGVNPFGGMASYTFPQGPGQYEAFSANGAGYFSDGHHAAAPGFGSASTIPHNIYWGVMVTVG